MDRTASAASNEETLKPIVARYDGEIRYVDDQIGRLFDALRRLGRFDDALIAVVADHGESFGEHGAIGHGAWLYDTVLRIPFIVRWPGGRDGGTRVERPVSIVDVAPIIAAETGISFPDDIDGVLPGERTLILAEEVPNALFKKHVVDGKTPLDRDLIAGVRWPHKVIINMPGAPELFRLDRDPAEAENLADETLADELQREVLDVVGSLKRPEPSAPHPMSDEVRKRLQALGYVN
jgi:arylsulfatase A-like enzyme